MRTTRLTQDLYLECPELLKLNGKRANDLIRRWQRLDTKEGKYTNDKTPVSLAIRETQFRT